MLLIFGTEKVTPALCHFDLCYLCCRCHQSSCLSINFCNGLCPEAVHWKEGRKQEGRDEAGFSWGLLALSPGASPFLQPTSSRYATATIWPYGWASFFLDVRFAMSSLIDCEGLEDSVNPQKEYICQERLLVVNWAQLHKWPLAAIADTGLLCTVHFREKPHTELSTSCIGLL